MIVHTFRSLLKWLGGHGYVVLGVVLLIVAGTWGFVELAGEVTEGETQQFDQWAVDALSKPDTRPPPATPRTVPVGPPWLQEVGRDMTALGGIAVAGLVTGAVFTYLLLVRKRAAAFVVLAATLGGLLISTALKAAFDRPRPNVSHFSHVYTSSFPSGHSMLSAVVYLTLGTLLVRIVPGRLVKVFILFVALGLTMLVGVSRVYMGVHYPTDVLAGWTAGLVWAMLCWLVARQLQIRGTIERDTDPTPDDDND